jgi:hypothetical protein
MKLPEFLLVQQTSEIQSALIIHTPTLYIGQVWRFTDPFEFSSFEGIKRPVQDHMIYIVFKGNFQGRFTELDKNVIDRMLDRMGDFYYKEEVLRKPGFFKRFKL